MREHMLQDSFRMRTSTSASVFTSRPSMEPSTETWAFKILGLKNSEVICTLGSLTSLFMLRASLRFFIVAFLASSSYVFNFVDIHCWPTLNAGHWEQILTSTTWGTSNTTYFSTKQASHRPSFSVNLPQRGQNKLEVVTISMHI